MKITINLPPITKKNHQQIVKARGHLMVIPSKQYRQYEKDCSELIEWDGEPIDYPVQVKCLYYMPTRRRVDMVNLLEASCDVLVHCGVLADDNSKIIVSHDGSRVLYDKEHPRTEIEIERILEEEKEK